MDNDAACCQNSQQFETFTLRACFQQLDKLPRNEAWTPVAAVVVYVAPIIKTRYDYCLSLSITDPSMRSPSEAAAAANCWRSKRHVSIFADSVEKLPDVEPKDVLILLDGQTHLRAGRLEVKVQAKRLRYVTFSRQQFDAAAGEPIRIGKFYPRPYYLSPTVSSLVRTLFQWFDADQQALWSLNDPRQENGNGNGWTVGGENSDSDDIFTGFTPGRSNNVESGPSRDADRMTTGGEDGVEIISAAVTKIVERPGARGGEPESARRLLVVNGTSASSAADSGEVVEAPLKKDDEVLIYGRIVAYSFRHQLAGELPEKLYLYLADGENPPNPIEPNGGVAIVVVGVGGQVIWDFFGSILEYDLFNSQYLSPNPADRIAAVVRLTSEMHLTLEHCAKHRIVLDLCLVAQAEPEWVLQKAIRLDDSVPPIDAYNQCTWSLKPTKALSVYIEEEEVPSRRTD